MRPHPVPAAALIVLLAACSSGGSHSSATATPSTGGALAATTSAPAPVPCGSGGATGANGGGDAAPPGDIPDNQAYVTYQPSAGGYRVDTPEGWARTGDGAKVMFSDKLDVIAVEVAPAPVAPTTASAAATELPRLAATTTCFSDAKVSQVTRKAGTAVLIAYSATSTPDPVTGKSVRDDVERYEFWTAGRQAVLTLTSPHGSDNVDPWRRVTDSYTWLP